jgi:hypothetical protein
MSALMFAPSKGRRQAKNRSLRTTIGSASRRQVGRAVIADDVAAANSFRASGDMPARWRWPHYEPQNRVNFDV